MTTIVISSDQRPDGWSDGAAAYDEWFVPVTSRFAVNALRLLGLEPGQRLLDVAAGTGALTLQAAAAGLHVVAVDFAPGMVGILRRRLDDAGLRADVEQMDGQSLGFSTASFDAACSMFGLIFYPDLDVGAAELRRVVRPGGQVLVAAWDRSGFPLQEAVERALGAAVPGLTRHGEPPPAFRVADPDTLVALLERAGLREVTVLEVSHDWAVRDPGALFRSLRLWAAPMRPAFGRLAPAQIERAAAAFAEIMADGRPVGGLRMTALFGHGIR
jgi:SAM-dependent methyltransferase